MIKLSRLPFLTLLLFLALPACHKNGDAAGGGALTHKATAYPGKLAHDWIDLASQMIKENYLYGPHAARTFGYLGLTAWESVCHGIPDGKSMAGQINDYAEAASFDPETEYDWGIVLGSAMRTVFPALIENINNAQRSQVDVLAAQQESELMKNGISELVRQDSRDLGVSIGKRITDRMRKDGRELIRNIVTTIPARDDAHKWYWDPSTLGQTPVEPVWGTLRTFVIDNAEICQPEPPFPYSETPGTDMYQQAKEVFDIDPTPTNTGIAYQWEDGVGRSSSPAGHWVSIARQLLERGNNNLAESAKTYCLLGFAVADGFSACWYVKYKYFLLRPVTYIREVFDQNWTPVVNTPPYPDYMSCAAVMGGVAPAVLSHIFGDTGFIDRTHQGSPLYTPEGGPFILPERTFYSLTQAGEEQMFSQVIGGMHFRRSCEEGLKSGRCIGGIILKRIDFGY